MTLGVHGTTYGGNPLAMAVANAVLDEMLQKDFLKNVQEIGLELKGELQNLQKEFPNLIEEIRGVGLMLGIKFNSQIENSEVVKRLIANQLLTIPASDNVIRILPPLIINSTHVAEAMTALRLVMKSF